MRGNMWVVEALLECGIEIDSSIFPAERGHGGYDNFGRAEPSLLSCSAGKIKEFPINVGKFLGKTFVFSGGGYFRLMPLCVIQSLTKQTNYVMTYFHPRDFDSEQPVLDLPLSRKFKSYVGLKGAYQKMDQWLSQNEFIDIATADKLINWDEAQCVEISSH